MESQTWACIPGGPAGHGEPGGVSLYTADTRASYKTQSTRRVPGSKPVLSVCVCVLLSLPSRRASNVERNTGMVAQVGSCD